MNERQVEADNVAGIAGGAAGGIVLVVIVVVVIVIIIKRRKGKPSVTRAICYAGFSCVFRDSTFFFLTARLDYKAYHE